MFDIKDAFYKLKNKTKKKRERESNKVRKSVRKFAIARPSAHESRARKTRESMRSDTGHVTKPSSAIGRKKVARTNQNQDCASLNESEERARNEGGYN